MEEVASDGQDSSMKYKNRALYLDEQLKRIDEEIQDILVKNSSKVISGLSGIIEPVHKSGILEQAVQIDEGIKEVRDKLLCKMKEISDTVTIIKRGQQVSMILWDLSLFLWYVERLKRVKDDVLYESELLLLVNKELKSKSLSLNIIDKIRPSIKEQTSSFIDCIVSKMDSALCVQDLGSFESCVKILLDHGILEEKLNELNEVIVKGVIELINKRCESKITGHSRQNKENIQKNLDKLQYSKSQSGNSQSNNSQSGNSQDNFKRNLKDLTFLDISEVLLEIEDDVSGGVRKAILAETYIKTFRLYPNPEEYISASCFFKKEAKFSEYLKSILNKYPEVRALVCKHYPDFLKALCFAFRSFGDNCIDKVSNISFLRSIGEEYIDKMARDFEFCTKSTDFFKNQVTADTFKPTLEFNELIISIHTLIASISSSGALETRMALGLNKVLCSIAESIIKSFSVRNKSSKVKTQIGAINAMWYFMDGICSAKNVSENLAEKLSQGIEDIAQITKKEIESLLCYMLSIYEASLPGILSSHQSIAQVLKETKLQLSTLSCNGKERDFCAAFIMELANILLTHIKVSAARNEKGNLSTLVAESLNLLKSWLEELNKDPSEYPGMSLALNSLKEMRSTAVLCRARLSGVYLHGARSSLTGLRRTILRQEGLAFRGINFQEERSLSGTCFADERIEKLVRGGRQVYEYPREYLECLEQYVPKSGLKSLAQTFRSVKQDLELKSNRDYYEAHPEKLHIYREMKYGSLEVLAYLFHYDPVSYCVLHNIFKELRMRLNFFPQNVLEYGIGPGTGARVLRNDIQSIKELAIACRHTHMLELADTLLAVQDKLKNLADDRPKNLADDKPKNLADDKPKNLADDKLQMLADDKPKNLADDKLQMLADDKLKNLTENSSPLHDYQTPVINYQNPATFSTKYFNGLQISGKYDLVLSSYALCFMPNKIKRDEAILKLWDLTKDTLVIVEFGTLSGLNLVSRAKELIFRKSRSGRKPAFVIGPETRSSSYNTAYSKAFSLYVNAQNPLFKYTPMDSKRDLDKVSYTYLIAKRTEPPIVPKETQEEIAETIASGDSEKILSEDISRCTFSWSRIIDSKKLSSKEYAITALLPSGEQRAFKVSKSSNSLEFHLASKCFSNGLWPFPIRA